MIQRDLFKSVRERARAYELIRAFINKIKMLYHLLVVTPTVKASIDMFSKSIWHQGFFPAQTSQEQQGKIIK